MSDAKLIIDSLQDRLMRVWEEKGLAHYTGPTQGYEVNASSQGHGLWTIVGVLGSGEIIASLVATPGKIEVRSAMFGTGDQARIFDSCTCVMQAIDAARRLADIPLRH